MHQTHPQVASISFSLRWLILTLTGFWLAAPSQAAIEYFVAPNGSDTNSGTRAKPFASLEAAQKAIRERKAVRSLPSGGITVWIRGGTYERSSTLALTAQDSGTPQARITFSAWNNERVRLLGGRVIRDFTPVSDPAVLARLPAPARRPVLQADLRAAGVGQLGDLHSRGFGRPTTPAHTELFFGGRPMTLARWPNEGEWEKIADFPSATAQGDEHGGKLGALTNGFHYAGDRPRGWQDFTNAWVHGYWAWDWANSYERIASLDLDQRLIKTAPPHGLYGFRKSQRFYFVNILEELDQPGEWFIDHRQGLLYFWPPSPLSSGETLVSLLETPLVSMDQASYITLGGLELEGTRGDAVRIRDGTNAIVSGCKIRLIGNYGVQIEGGRNHHVARCDIENTGDGGVSLSGGDRQTLTPGGHQVENCHFQKQGRWSKCYVPAVILSGVGHRVAHNLIHDHPHCAILYSGNEHQIEFNEIHHVALETGDVGAIYAGRDWTFRGNVIRHNFIHHTGGVGMGSMGVYMDDCVSGTLIEGNIFYQVTRAAFLGGGRDHRVVNNIFVDCKPAVQVDGRGLDQSPVWHNMVYGFMKQQLAAVPAPLYRIRYPAIGALDPFYAGTSGVPPEGNVIARNICVDGQWLQVGWHASEKLLQLGDNYVGPDPGFANRTNLNFRLKPNTVTRRIGFEPIPVDLIGPQPNPNRRNPETRGRR